MMKNNKGFGTKEILIVIVLLMIVFSVLGVVTLKGANHQRFQTMKENALAFSKAVVADISVFHNLDVVYLTEAVDSGSTDNIRNPFGGGFCLGSESKVETQNGQSYASLRCGDYYIDHASFNDVKSVSVYKVGEWVEDKSKLKESGADKIEEKELYNCQDENGKNIYDDYYENFYLVYLINKDKGTDFVFIENIDTCKVVPKTFYRIRSEQK